MNVSLHAARNRACGEKKESSMKNAILSLGFTLVAATLSTSATAATYYFSDCATGATSCTPGNDSNSGTSASSPFRSISKLTSMFNNGAPGDKFLLARGGAWANVSMLLRNYKTNATSPVVLDAYTPPSGATAKPILRASQGARLLDFEDSGAADAGYLIQNIDLRGDNVGEAGLFTWGNVSDITLNNMTIQGFRLGIQCTVNNQRVNVRNSTFKGNSSQGILWECANSVIENNTFDNNGFGEPIFDHSIYVNSSDNGAKNVTIRGNTLINNALNNGKCAAVPLVAHGNIDGLVIENNLVYQAPNTSLDTCWGIAVDAGYGTAESFKRVVIRGNTVVNVGGIGIGCSSCISPIIENNVVVQESGPYLTGIAIPDRPASTGDAADTGGIIRNNSIYFGSPKSGSVGVALVNGSVKSGSNVQVVSNLIHFGSGDADHQCFNTTGMGIGSFTAFNNNLCYDAAGNGKYSKSYATLSAAKSAGFDTAGLNSNPKITIPTSSNGWSMALVSGSPAINAGHATLSSTVEKLLSLTRNDPDIGAYEYSSSADRTPPAAPQSLVVQ
jgi:hypothetical protein